MRLFISWIVALVFIAQVHGQQTIKVGIVGDADNHQVNWTTEIGYNYLVEVSFDLVAWTDTGIVQAGTGAVVTYGFSTPTEPKLFYRIRVRPEAMRPGFDDYVLLRNDDGSTPQVPIGFPINLFGTVWNNCYINNNGNVTFDGPKIDFTPDPLQVIGFPIVAPFWADVDTRASGSSEVTYSYNVEQVNGRSAFGANWKSVGYFNINDDRLNSFQLILIDRADTGTNNFDIEFNYDIILWESGDHFTSGGIDGYGGKPARAGLSNGSNQTIELQYSAQTLLQLDSNPNTEVPNFTTGLIYRSRNSTVPGRFVFQVRAGQVLGALSVNAGLDQPIPGATTTTLNGSAFNPAGGAVTVLWSIVDGPPGVTISDPTILNPTVTFPADEQITLQLTATSVADPNVTAADTITINP